MKKEGKSKGKIPSEEGMRKYVFLLSVGGKKLSAMI
jgi:hypothetical protein